MKIVVVMINLFSSVPLNFHIPERVWKGNDVFYTHMRVFGYKAFIHVPKNERSKLDNKTKQLFY
jgi:hypothetical protein